MSQIMKAMFRKWKKVKSCYCPRIFFKNTAQHDFGSEDPMFIKSEKPKSPNRPKIKIENTSPEAHGGKVDLSRYTYSYTANRDGIDNTPGEAEVKNLLLLDKNIVVALDELFGGEVKVTSGYRSEALNAAVKGSSGSQHVRGEAVDFKFSGLNSVEIVCLILESGIVFDQLIAYHPTKGGHNHISYTERRANRNEILYKHSDGKFYEYPWEV